jgi:hypothetical protein
MTKDNIDFDNDSIYDYIIEDTLKSYVPKRKNNEIEEFTDLELKEDSGLLDIPFILMIFFMIIIIVFVVFYSL